MMLHLGQDEHIARLQVLASPGVCHQVDRFGGVAGKNHLARGWGIDKSCHFLPGAFIQAVDSSARTWMPRWILALECW